MGLAVSNSNNNQLDKENEEDIIRQVKGSLTFERDSRLQFLERYYDEGEGLVIPFPDFPEKAQTATNLKAGVRKKPQRAFLMQESLVGPIGWDMTYLMPALESMRHNPSHAEEYRSWIGEADTEMMMEHYFYNRFVSPYGLGAPLREEKVELLYQLAGELGSIAKRLPVVIVDFPLDKVLELNPYYQETAKQLPHLIIAGHAQLVRNHYDREPTVNYIRLPYYLSNSLVIPDDMLSELLYSNLNT